MGVTKDLVAGSHREAQSVTKCRDCIDVPPSGRGRCLVCRALNAARVRKYRASLEPWICKMCCKREVTPGKKTCQVCRDKAREYARAEKAKELAAEGLCAPNFRNNAPSLAERHFAGARIGTVAPSGVCDASARTAKVLREVARRREQARVARELAADPPAVLGLPARGRHA